MNHRLISDIFPEGYPYQLDEGEVLRICEARFECAYASIEDMTEWIERRYADPYQREALAEGVWLYISDRSSRDGDERLYIDPFTRQQIDAQLLRIVRHAQADQDVEMRNLCDPKTNLSYTTEETSVIEARVHQLERHAAEQQKELDELKEQFRLLVDSRTADQPTSRYCTYLIPSSYRSLDELEVELARAARRPARELVALLERWQKLGYVDLRGDSHKAIYDNLNQHFGLHYGPSNWKAAARGHVL